MKNRSAKKVNNKNVVNVKVKETVDLTSPLIEANYIKQRMLKDGTALKGSLLSKKEKIEKIII